MQTVIAGAGPTGLYLAISLARRGHRGTVIDRDPGPDVGEEWARKGVMQFQLPHFFRPQVRDALLAEAPEVVDGLVAAGAMLTPLNPLWPDFLGLRTRRSTFERVLRRSVLAEPGVSFIAGHAERVVTCRSRAVGVVVDGTTVDADLVVDASGRSGRLTKDLRATAIGGDSGFSYASRHYQLLPGAEPGPLNAPPGWGGEYDGYLVIIFLQDAGTFQTLIVRRSDDHALAALRHDAVFELVANAIPSLAPWIDPQRSTATSSVMAGAGLTNSYCGQLTEDGTVGLPGLVCVGDSVLTTNPADGKGVSTSLMQAQQLLTILDADHDDLGAAVLSFDRWCQDHMKPWFEDQVRKDAGLTSRWRGEPIDFTQPLPSDLICSLAECDPSVMPAVGAYFSMLAGPSALLALEPRAKENLRAGFRPAVEPGPTRDEIADLISGLAT